jgi:hypothetical protein
MQAITLSFAKLVSQPFSKAFRVIENLEKTILGGDKFLSEIQDLK